MPDGYLMLMKVAYSKAEADHIGTFCLFVGMGDGILF